MEDPLVVMQEFSMPGKQSITRKYPECRQGVLDLSQLHKGVECTHCRSLIEVNFAYSAGIPIVLAILVTIGFQYDVAWLGLTATVLIVVFTAGYQSVFSKYLPLKHYNSD